MALPGGIMRCFMHHHDSRQHMLMLSHLNTCITSAVVIGGSAISRMSVVA